MSEQGWGRGRLIAILAGAVLVALALAAGLVFAVMRAVAGPGDASTEGGVTPGAADNVAAVVELPEGAPGRREQVAAAPMLSAAPDDSRQGQISSTPAEAIEVPVATSTGPAGVPTGFPHTPEGAVAQLAAIDVTVLRAMSVPLTNQVHQEWTTGGEAAQWVMTQNVSSFLSAADQAGQTRQADLAVVPTPAAAQVKGTDGDDWVLACVLLDVRASLSHEARMAYGHCEAMTWQADRWVIDTGVEVAQAPSTWPGTDLANQAGWRTWAPALPSD